MKIFSTNNYIKKIKEAQYGVGENLPAGVSESDPNFYSEDIETGTTQSIIYQNGQEFYVEVTYEVVGNVIDETSIEYGDLKDSNGRVVDEDPILSEEEEDGIMEDIQTDALNKGLISQPDF